MDDEALVELVRAIVAADRARTSELLRGSPTLARTALGAGATRSNPTGFFFDEIRHHCYAGDTALHIAAVVYDVDCARELVGLGAAVGAVNRRRAQPLHYAVDGGPDAPTWNPPQQAAMVTYLVGAGADIEAGDANGTTPLLRAVRNRCAAAVEALLQAGADPRATNKKGSTPMQLANTTSGRGGTGTDDAKAEQAKIVGLLRAYDQA